MTSILKRKRPLYLIVIVAVVLVMAVACKKKPTQPLAASLSGDSTEYQTPDLSGDSAENQNPEAVDLVAGEYKSVYQYQEGYGYSERTFYYKVELKEVDGKMNLLWKKGDYVNSAGSYGGDDYGILRSLTRDSSKDIAAENKKAFGAVNSEEVYYIRVSDDGNSLEFFPNKMEIPFKFTKIK